MVDSNIFPAQLSRNEVQVGGFAISSYDLTTRELIEEAKKLLKDKQVQEELKINAGQNPGQKKCPSYIG